jgi:hypothetical protein
MHSKIARPLVPADARTGCPPTGDLALIVKFTTVSVSVEPQKSWFFQQIAVKFCEPRTEGPDGHLATVGSSLGKRAGAVAYDLLSTFGRS